MDNNFITVRVPLRLSFLGGGSDIPNFYEKNQGSVISTAIDKYIYVSVKKHGDLFDENYRLNYSLNECEMDIKNIKNDIARSIFLQYGMHRQKLYLSTIADLPAQSGLGSSSSFAVGLHLAMSKLIGLDMPSKNDLAELACRTEIKDLGHNIGKQDQYAASYGSANLFRFHKNGDVETVNLDRIREMHIDKLLSKSVLIWTNVQRSAAQILKKQKTNSKKNELRLRQMVDIAEDFYSALASDDFEKKFIEYMRESWALKSKLTDATSNSHVDSLINFAIENGADCCKLLGAGGGGFVFCYFSDHDKKQSFISNNKLEIIEVKRSKSGAQLIGNA